MNFPGLILQASGNAGIGAFGGVGIFLAIAFGVVVLAAAFFSFVMLRKTLKMALRLVIVAVLALIALIGSAACLWFSSSSNSDSAKPRPANSRSR
jgi:predicted anti-sigma-YlaC factor YlaD